MEQKRPAPRLALWLLVGLLAAVTAQASSISLKRSGSCRGCVAACAPKDNSIYQSSSSGLTSLWRKSQQQQEAYPASAHFEPGKTYTYRVHTWTAALASFATEQQQGQGEEQDYQPNGERLAELQATAWITPLSECEVSMQLKDIQLTAAQLQFEEEEKAAFIAQLANPILFGYSHGVVTEVCTDEADQDQTEVLNLKKSIISALQTIPTLAEHGNNAYPVKVIESDVNGDCQTEYTVSKQSSTGKYLIEKEKNLATGCENTPRQQAMYSSWKNALLSHSAHQKAFCVQTVDHRQVIAAQCQSAHTINAPGLAHMDLDVIANVELVAEEVFETAEDESKSAQVPEQWRRHAPRLMMSSPISAESSRIFKLSSKDGKMKKGYRNQQNQNQIIDGRVQLKSVLEEICEDMVAHGRRPTTTTVRLVQTLAEVLAHQASHQDVAFVWKSIVQAGKVCGGGQEAKKLQDIFVDTAASVMNGPSAAVVRDELIRFIDRAAETKDALYSQRARYLAVVASFATEPTPEAIRQLLPELLEKVEDTHVILSLTALLKKTNSNSEQQMDAAFIESLYQTVLRKVTELLSRKGANAEADIVRLLTALENIDARAAPVAGQERLVKISTDKRLPLSVRVAAIKSAEHIEMIPALRQTMLALFGDRAEANECRLAAYRTLMHSSITLQELAHIRRVVVEQEKSNADVANYVCSHQKNLRSSEDARKRELLPAGAPLFPEPQSLANIALSRNFEYSSINEKTQVGAIIEADLIMEAESRVPRSITFNLTVPVAEQQIPVIEVTVRQAGLEEAVIRRLQALRDIKSPAHALRELGRLVRMAKKSEKQNQKKQYQEEEDKDESKKKKKVQIFINIDGKNVFLWDSVQCGEEHGSIGRNGGEFETVLEQLYKRLPISLDETMVVMPLKHRVRLPTASGIPVTFQLNTTLIVSYEAQLKGVQSGAESRLEAHIKPTFVVETGVGLVADLPYGQPQQRVAIINRQVSSPTFHVKTSYKADSRQFKAKFLLPESEQIIARYETEFIQTADAMEQQQQLKKSKKSTSSASGAANADEIFQALNKQMRRAFEKKRAAKNARAGVFYRSGGKSAEVCMPALEQLTGFTYCVQHFDVEDLKESFVNDQDSTTGKPKLVYLSQVKLVKTDRAMEGLEFGLQLPAQLYAPEATSDEIKFVLHYDTPGSTTANRRLNAELMVRLPQSAAEHFIVRVDVDSPLKKFAGQIRLQNDRQQKGVKIELTTDRAERQFLFEANAIFNAPAQKEEKSDRQIKLQLRLQPTAKSSMSTFEGDFAIAGHQTASSNNHKQKVTAKLTANEKKVLEVAFVKAGQLISLEQDCKASLTFVLDLFGAQLQYNSMLNKVAATGTIKSTGELKYNRFLAFSRRVRDQVESIGYQVQFTGFNRQKQQEQEIKKIFLHWALQSTQFPSLKQELTYNIKVGKEIAEQFEQELLFKWSAAPEEKRIRFAQELKQLANSRTREQKLQATAELEITPFAYHHEAKFVVDMPNKEENSRPTTLTAELKATNRKTGQTTVEARWMHSILSAQPLKAVYEGDLALGADRWFVHSVRNSMEESKAKHYEGKASFGLKVKNDHYWLPNLDQKVALRYNFQLRSSPADRVPVIAAAAKVPGSHIWNLYARLINTVDRFENEMDVEDAYFGRYHQKSAIVCSAEETCTSQWAVERPGGKLVYKGETERNLVAKTLRLKLEAGEEYLSAFGIEVTTQLTDRIKSIDVKVANRRFAHQTRILADKADQKLEIRCQTKKDQQVTFELDAKSVEYFKVAQLKLKSELIEADIDLANLQTPALIRKGLQKRALFRTLFLERYPAEDSTIKVEIRLPRAELEHRVNVHAQMKTARQIEYTAETRHHGRNLLKVKVHLQPEGQESVAVSAEYKNGYTAELKLVKPDQSDAHQHQLEVNYRVAPKQIFHKSVARWAFNAEKEMPLFGGSLYRLPYHFRLITLDTKSHLGQEAIFDLAYRCNEANPSAEYAHELLFSGRQSHAELKLSRFGFDYDNAQYAPKAFFTLKTKALFGGLEHTTELKDVSVERRQLTITSKTARRGESIAEVEARIIYQEGQQSTIKVQLPAAGRQLTAQLVPFTSLEVHCNLIGDAAWRHTARLERSAERRQWSVKVNSKNERKEGGEKWSAQLSHQCDQHTTLELESPIVRGLIEVQIPARKLRIDLKGASEHSAARYSNSKWTAYEHRFEGQIDKQAKKLTIRSTTSKQAKTIAFIDAELYAPFSSEEARASTLKLELEQPIIKKSELAPFKLAITVDPKAAAWELTAAAGNKWKHECSVKRIAPKTISIHTETRKHGQTIARLEVSELSAKKAVFHAQAEPEKVFGGISSQWVPSSLKSATPFDVKGTIDLEEREIAFQAHAKRSDRLVKFEAKAKKDTAAAAAHLKNVHIECSWDAKRAPQKRALIQVRIQDRATAPERLVATIRGDLIDRPFHVAIDVPRRASEMFRSRSASFNIEAEMKSQSGGEPMIAKISRAVQPQTGDCRSAVELRKGDFVVVKAEAKVTGFAKKSLSSSSSQSSVQKKHLSMKVQSDLKSAAAAALLNAEIEMSRECTYQQCQTKASAEYGSAAEQKKSIKFEGANVADALRGQLVINAGRRMLQQTVKFEFIKPESKLQINVFNQAGRQVDVNVDLARPLQKKFQIVSFVEAIPTVDIEAAYGENSRLVLQVSFQEEKKLELALNWFGQWRRDFKLEALFKCFSSPALEMVVTSRHPAGVDEIEGMLKVAGKEWAAKLSRTFDESRANWNTRTLIKANGAKKVELVVECTTRGEQSKRLVKTYKVHLDGVRQATGHVTVHLRQPSGIVEMIQVEGGKDAQHPRQATLELFFGHHDQASRKTGVKVTIEEKAFFGLVHITNDAANTGNKRTSMVRLELPEEIEYVLRNEIEYAQHQQKQSIKSIRSELKKRSQPVPIYQTVITFEEADQQLTDMKVMRIEVRSSSFAEAPKQMVIRYNFRPKVCHSVETLQPQSEQLSNFANYANYEQYEQAQQQEKKKMDQAKKMMKKGEKKSSFPYGEAKCWRVELIAGDLVNGNGNQANSQQQNEGAGIVRIAAEYIKAPVAGSFHYNRTVAFRMESSKPAQQHRSINCQLIGHVSPKSFGIVWANQNRHGQQKTGMIYADKQKQVMANGHQEEMINIYVREQNAHQPSKDFVGEVHFSPAHIRKTLSIGAKFDQAKLRRWLVGELPTLHEMVKDEASGAGSLRKKMARALKEELAHKMATLKEAYDAELARPLMAEAAAVGEQLKASEDQLMAEIVEVVKRADFSQQIEKLLAMIDLERALDEAERSLAEGWQAMEAKVQAAVESGCQKSDRCRKMINRIRDYEIRRFLKATFEEKVKKVSSAIKRVLPEDLMQLAKEFQAAHAYEVNEEEDDDEASIYRAQNVDSDSDSSEAPVAYRRAMIIKHGARLLKMAQPELTKTVMKHLNHMAQHFDYDEDAQDDQDDFQLKKKKNVDWSEVRGDIYDMAADIIEQQAKKAEESKKHQEQENSAAPWSIWTSGFGNGSSSGSGANNYQDYSKYASKWGKQQQEKKNKLQKKKSGYYGFDSVDEPEVDDEDDREEFRRKWSFSPKRGEFFFGSAAQQPQMQAAY